MFVLVWIVCQCCVASAWQMSCDTVFREAGRTQITCFMRCHFWILSVTSTLTEPRGCVGVCISSGTLNEQRILWVQNFRGSPGTCPFFSNPVFEIICHCYGMQLSTQVDTHTHTADVVWLHSDTNSQTILAILPKQLQFYAIHFNFSSHLTLKSVSEHRLQAVIIFFLL